MGMPISQESFSEQDYNKYQIRLREQLDVLADIINMPGFGGDITSFGAELEIYVVDERGKVNPINRDVLVQTGDPRLTLELNKFNLEYNLSPVNSSGNPFSKIKQEIDEVHTMVSEAASQLDARVVPIGILPTLRRTDFDLQNMTELSRYRALCNGLQSLRGKAFRVSINGQDPLNFNCNDITLEGANTSFQFHIRTPVEHYANTWNAVQLVTPLVLALGSNSPTLFGHRLWQETRIALFKQSVDNRHRGNQQWRKPARVNFGHGWIHHGPWELFSENIALFEPVLPILSGNDAMADFAAGELPSLDELRLHQSTIWSWNRAVYDPEAAGHFRIECRSLPAGPTSEDMLANAALLTGLAMGLRDEMPFIVPTFPFELAEHNFYRAAQNGLEADILWPQSDSVGPREVNLCTMINELLPVAERGLKLVGVDGQEIKYYLDNVQTRIDQKMTGAKWQLDTLSHYFKSYELGTALEKMLADYILETSLGRSIVNWDRP